MELKYVGPKPIISHTGIEFDNNKEDKFVYLNIVVQLLKSLNHSYIKDKIYTYQTDSSRLSNDEIYQELKKYCPKLSSLIEEKSHDVQNEINHNLKRAHENNIIKSEDKITLENNINIMSDYLIQRSKNKSAYYCAVDVLAELVKNENIGFIVVPMFQKFAHVLHSVQGSLRKQKNPIDSKLEIYQEDGKLLAKLIINN
ncbi:hypothetical protein HUE87_06175 [Candidatus Sulfurimonas marisnigri]|uniref:Uncharacterized protein n=1 Tax=Candidatus Sulfurimonas marisnigri TaxID=2740405 RepID=A0A7S7M2G9_9BACT|nr:hypothetical protein [Candidatus Sulfurimonas marisnigri]QOY55808.1 hypothetical protein HUE87_06175 [Candidatus Sulfurimonas marisnigri]